jgi:hypothetical protein
MKLTFKRDLQPLRLILHLSGETAEDLRLFQRYIAHELRQGDRSNEEILVTIIQRFFEAGDPQFLAWKRAQKNGGAPLPRQQKREGGGPEVME